MASRMQMKFSFQSKSKALKQAHVNDSIIRDLMKLPNNRKCINCNSLAPQYVCTTFSTFVCLTCSGIHREFSHRVKSVSMANFTPEEVAALQAGGNQRAQKVYLSRWDSQQRSAPDGSDVLMLRDFIKHTYVERRYADSPDNCHESPRVQKSDDGSVNSSSYSFKERYSCYGEDPLRNSINWRNSISQEAVNDKLLHDMQHVRSTDDGLSACKEAPIEQKLSRHLEELNSINEQLREAIQPFESSHSPNVYSCDASPLQEPAYSSRSGSDANGRAENTKDMVGVVTESTAELEPHIYGSTPTPQSASSTCETSFSTKFQAAVLKMMEHKNGSVKGSKHVSEPQIPDGVQVLQTCLSIGEQTMASTDNWASFDPPVEGKVCPPFYSLNLEPYSSVSTNKGMSDSNPVNLDSLAPVSFNWGISDSSDRQPSSTSGCAPDLRHDMLLGVPYQPPTSSTDRTNRNKELKNSEALFAATFSSFSWSQAPLSCESGNRIPAVALQEKQSSSISLKSRNPFDVSSEPTNFQVSMRAQEEHRNHSYSTRLLHGSSTLSNSSQFFSSPSSPYIVMPLEGPFYAESPSTCTYTTPPPVSPLSLGLTGHEGDANDGYWHSNSPSHHTLPARSKSFSFRGNPFA